MNAALLLEIVNCLSDEQWKIILEAFCKNKQIWEASQCPTIFSDIFNESRKIHGFVKDYWLSFKNELDKLNCSFLNELKDLINTYVLSEPF